MRPWRHWPSFICWLFGHEPPMWEVDAEGVVWVCRQCRRKRRSVLRHLKPGSLM